MVHPGIFFCLFQGLCRNIDRSYFQRAAKGRIQGKSAGMYSMEDIIGNI